MSQDPLSDIKVKQCRGWEGNVSNETRTISWLSLYCNNFISDKMNAKYFINFAGIRGNMAKLKSNNKFKKIISLNCPF